jgi:cytochrome bd-type quinol oxidase subunit 2
MSSLELDDGELDDEVEPHSGTGTLRRLLDPAFGHFVWAAHFLVVYIGAAVACVLGLGAAGEGARTTFLTVLIVLTVVATAIVVGHAVWRHRQYRDHPDQRFRMVLTIGNSGIAVVGIVWQLFPLLLVPVCA